MMRLVCISWRQNIVLVVCCICFLTFCLPLNSFHANVALQQEILLKLLKAILFLVSDGATRNGESHTIY